MLYVSLVTEVGRRASVLPLVQIFLFLTMLACAQAMGADAPAALQPVTVCEALAHPDDYAGKPLAVVGRFSFRENGRFISEKNCVLRVVLDGRNGPVPPVMFAVNNETAKQKLADVRKTTALANFRFGSSDYDRWAMVYGRIEPVPASEKRGAREFGDASSQILCRSQTLVIYLREP